MTRKPKRKLLTANQIWRTVANRCELIEHPHSDSCFSWRDKKTGAVGRWHLTAEAARVDFVNALLIQ